MMVYATVLEVRCPRTGQLLYWTNTAHRATAYCYICQQPHAAERQDFTEK